MSLNGDAGDFETQPESEESFLDAYPRNREGKGSLFEGDSQGLA
jgi:hypothetical protein